MKPDLAAIEDELKLARLGPWSVDRFLHFAKFYTETGWSLLAYIRELEAEMKRRDWEKFAGIKSRIQSQARAAAFEEAAKVVEQTSYMEVFTRDHHQNIIAINKVAATIRSLKEKND